MEFLKAPRNKLMMDRKIYLVFAVVVLIAISNAIISAITIHNSKKIVYDISLVTNPTLEKLEEMTLLVTRSRMLVTNWVHMPNNSEDKDSLLTLNSHVYPQLRTSLLDLTDYWHSRKNFDQMNRIFYEYERLMVYEGKITRGLASFDDYMDPMKKFAAEELLENEIIPRSNIVLSQLKQLNMEKKIEADAMQDRMIESYYYLLVMVLGLAVIIIVSVVLAGGYMLRQVILPIMKIRDVIMQISKGELPDFKLRFSYNALGEMSYAIRQLIDGLKRTAHFASEIGKGNLSTPFQPLSENDVFGSALLEMRRRLASVAESDTARNWSNEGVAGLGNILHKNTDDLHQLCEEIILGLVTYIEAQQGAIYLVNQESQDKFIELAGYYGFSKKIQPTQRIDLKEGLVGQSISINKRIYVPNISDPEYFIETGLTRARQCHVFIMPLYVNGQALGAIEIVFAEEPTGVVMSFIEQFAEPVAASIFSLKASLFTRRLLKESQKQADELAMQDKELRQINGELISQSQLLRFSEEELKIANSELEAKAVLLEEKNLVIEEARQSIAFKAEQLEKSNHYKSSFLANMSHELRTPLNSVLILAKLLAENRDKTLTDKQTEYARVIHKSGSDLLLLINDILDLSKIESGKIELFLEEITPADLFNELHNLFREIANEKGIRFNIRMDEIVPPFIISDRMRLDQILKNLLSNAFKFTPKDGTVTLSIEVARRDLIFKNPQLFSAEKIISISVTDTGIGIPDDKQQLVFEAFKQADGSTSRKFGGTGLGLAISRELAQMLGGDLMLSSREGHGSIFTVHLPDKLTTSAGNSHIHPQGGDAVIPIDQVNHQHHADPRKSEINDDRSGISQGEARILIIDDDAAFCKTMMGLAHQHHLKVITATQGNAGIELAIEFKPGIIMLDLQVQATDGINVLKKLKGDPILCNIPVYVFSTTDRNAQVMDLGAAGFIIKPPRLEDLELIFSSYERDNLAGPKKIMLVDSRKKEMLVILKQLHEREKNSSLLGVENLEDCIKNMNIEKFDCILVNASLDTIPANELLLKEIKEGCKISGTTFHMYDGMQPAIPDELVHPKAMSTGSPATRPTHDTAYPEWKEDSGSISRSAGLFKGIKVLLADDDMRNIYALTSMLESEGMNVICAYDGADAIQKLNENPEIQLVLMDIMMPVMDGYQSMTEIRKNEQWLNLPIVALTAQAMSGDREKCLEAGASEYLSKPVHIEQLLPIIKLLLHK